MFRTTSRWMMCALAGVIGWGLLASPVRAEDPFKVGEVYDLNVDSSKAVSDVAAEKTTSGFRYEWSHPGATYIAIHFKKFDLAPGDEVVISDASGGQKYRLTGLGKMDLGTFWAQHVKGDTVVLQLNGANNTPGKGFVIDSYAAGFVRLETPPVTEEICGANDLENAVCRNPSIEYTRGRAVARLLIQGVSLCTGWLASATNHLITNQHCIGTASAAANTDYEFGSEAPTCGSANCQLCFPGTVFSGATFIKTNAGLDYTLVQINSGNPQATFGFLQIDNRVAVVGEQIYLVSHPGGRAKEFAYNSTGDAGGVGRVLSLNEPTCSGATVEVGYHNDTEGGSSGSPVIAVSSQKVIVLHHCRGNAVACGDPNRGVPINQICNDIGGNFCAGCTTNADCNDANACTTDTCSAGVCSNTPINCNDNNACTTDSCSGGVCSNTPITCNDGNSCTTDSCNPASGCVATWPACGLNDGCCGPGCTFPSDPNCTSCQGAGASCTANSQCCSNNCKGKPGRQTCK